MEGSEGASLRSGDAHKYDNLLDIPITLQGSDDPGDSSSVINPSVRGRRKRE